MRFVSPGRKRDRVHLHAVRRVVAFTLALALAAAPVLPNAARAADSNKVTMDFRNVAIEEFVKTVSKLTGRNFIVDQNVRGAITILGPEPVPVEDVWRIFHSVLAAKSLAVVKVGSLYKIVAKGDAPKTQIRVVYGKQTLAPSEETIIQVVPLEYITAAEAHEFLKNFADKSAQIVQYSATETLFIADTVVNIAHLLALLEIIDVESPEEMAIIPIEHMTADSAATLVNEVFKGGGGGGGGGDDDKSPPARRISSGRMRSGSATAGSRTELRVLVDARLNRLIVIGSPSDIAAVKDFLAQVDVEGDVENQLVHVYYLQHADAESLASTLNNLLTNQTAAKRGSEQTQTKSLITADKTNNALIFMMSDAELLRNALDVLRKLDVPRQQVYVEAAIIEVGLDDGFDWLFSAGIASEQNIAGEDVTVFGGQALGGISPLVVNPSGLASISGLFAGALVTPEDGVLPPLGAILRTVATNSDIKVLSTPHLLTSDNEEAEIVVGDNVPFLTGQTATSGGNVISSIERRDVGITLRVTPLINDSDQVRLKIFQEISSVSAQAPAGLDVNQQGLITRKRSAKTDVVVANGQTIAIGGLISEEESRSESKVPVLGDIPILGWLFRSYKRQRRQTNLIIFLRPHIVRTQAELQAGSAAAVRDFSVFTEDVLTDGQRRFFESRGIDLSEEAKFDDVLVTDIGEVPVTAPAAVTAPAESNADGAPGIAPPPLRILPTPSAVTAGESSPLAAEPITLPVTAPAPATTGTSL